MVRKKPTPEWISQERLYELLQSEHLNETDVALACTLYLTGCRTIEACKLKAKDIEMKEVDGENLTRFSLWTAKNPQHPLRLIPVSQAEKVERLMLEKIGEYILYLKDEDFLFPKNYKTHARMLQRHMQKITINLRDRYTHDEFEYHLRPHYLRHCRLFHLANIYNLDALEVQAVAGWSDTRPFKIYASVEWQKIARKMLKKIEGKSVSTDSTSNPNIP